MRKTAFLILFLVLSQNPIRAEDNCFVSNKKVSYDIYFNNVLVGKIDYKYLGKKFFSSIPLEILSVSINVNIAKLFNLESQEYIYVDSKTHLPMRVERKVIFFGRKETIKELYNQKKGYVRIFKKDGKEKKIFYTQKPISNILLLLYCFPKDLDLKENTNLTFNLPNNKININVASSKTLTIKGKERSVYLIKGDGDRKFNLFLEKQTRDILQIEVNLAVGKILIVRDN